MPRMRSRNRIRDRIENLEFALIRLKGTHGLFTNLKGIISIVESRIEELNWALGKPMPEKENSK